MPKVIERKMKQYIFLILAIICEVAWALLLKFTNQFTKVGITIITLIAYFAALFFLDKTLKTMPVGLAYAVWAGSGMVLIALLGVVILKQHLDWPAIIGLSLILCGVLIINIFSKSIVH